ncbi:hypothetical protein GCM10025864_04290 [Luteimicrobium album]|uniref:Putative glutamate--cysteine ligase 2 n=1 Tax=Luteimicrobium album TaxID=1054550 RepID=A0ABQ6HWD0_9MICO|nr:hypothetical protein GCM10025864_04290 [Luteimicrobium album]
MTSAPWKSKRMHLPFAQSERSTVGIEWELALVDKDSGDLRQVAQTVLDAVRPEGRDAHPHIVQELLLNTVEVVSGVGRDVPDAAADLERAVEEIRAVTDPLRVELMCAGTHPFAQWSHQKVTDKARYNTLIDRTQWWGRQMLIYGVHVHVGIEDRRKVLPILRAMLTCFAHLQSLSASSPFWGGRDTNYASNRALMFQQLPTAGLPFQFQEWEELERYASDLEHTGVIDGFDEVRWDLRPSPATAPSSRGSSTASRTSASCVRSPRSRTASSRGSPACSTTASSSRPCRPGSCRRTSGGRPATAWTPSSSSTRTATRSS